MKIKRIDLEQPSKGLEDWFTGTVRIDLLFETEKPANGAGASVTFEPVEGEGINNKYLT